MAAFVGQGAIAIGNVLGSNSLNIGLILGLTALIYPLKVQRWEGGLLLAAYIAYVVSLWAD